MSIYSENEQPTLPTIGNWSGLTDAIRKQLHQGQLLYFPDINKIGVPVEDAPSDNTKILLVGEQNVVTVTNSESPYTVPYEVDIIIADGSTGTIDLNLPALGIRTGIPLLMIDYDNSNQIDVNADGTEQIRKISSDTDTSITMTSGNLLKIVDVGTHWQILQNDV